MPAIQEFYNYSFEKRIAMYKLALEDQEYEFLDYLHKNLNQIQLSKILKVCQKTHSE